MKDSLSCCADIQISPGTKQPSLTFCHWNLNGIAGHDLIKILKFQISSFHNILV